ncbi:MAG: sensor histidine kinase, partial [Polyangiaceae bacterium]
RELLVRVIQELATGRGEEPVRLEAEGDPNGNWDADRLAQVFSNLVSNALEHSPAGGEIRAAVEARAADQVTITVQNPGVIPAELLPDIFEPFRHGRQNAKSRGLGLGLYITKEIVAAHGGSIEVASSEGSGTRFRVVLPRWGPPPRESREALDC